MQQYSVSVSRLRQISSSLTIEVLAVELLNELQHHSVDGSLPQLVPLAETFKPSCFTAFVLLLDTIFELVDDLFDKYVVFWDGIELSNYLSSLVMFPIAKQVTAIKECASEYVTFKTNWRDVRGFREEENTRQQDQTPEHLQTDWNTPGS